MTQEPTTVPINQDDQQPVTRGDLSLWGGRLQEQTSEIQQGQNRLERAQGRLERAQNRLERGQIALEQGQTRLERLIIQQAQQIRDHTQALVEEVRQDLGGAQKNETDLLKDKQAQHEDRLDSLERHAGLA